MAKPSPISTRQAAVITAVVAGAATALMITMNSAEEPLSSPPEVVIDFVDADGNPVVPYASAPEVRLVEEQAQPTPSPVEAVATATTEVAEPEPDDEPDYEPDEEQYEDDSYEEDDD